jgi:hypothetical protein
LCLWYGIHSAKDPASGGIDSFRACQHPCSLLTIDDLGTSQDQAPTTFARICSYFLTNDGKTVVVVPEVLGLSPNRVEDRTVDPIGTEEASDILDEEPVSGSPV